MYWVQVDGFRVVEPFDWRMPGLLMNGK